VLLNGIVIGIGSIPEIRQGIEIRTGIGGWSRLKIRLGMANATEFGERAVTKKISRQRRMVRPAVVTTFARSASAIENGIGGWSNRLSGGFTRSRRNPTGCSPDFDITLFVNVSVR